MQNEMILKLLDAHLNKKTLKKQILTLEQWDHLLTKAFEQSILPLVYENVLSLIDNNQDKQYIKQKYNFPVIKEVSLQVQKTETFLKLYKHLYNNGVKPIIVKGLICRNIYPNPDFRVSGDEDIIVSSDQYEKCHKLMLSFPMMSDASDQDIDIKEEIKYLDERRMLLIEMHKVLFPGESIINTDWNTLFISTYTDTVEMNINNTPVISLSHSNHMLYLVLHLFKHFLHSGVGIRQVCDIMMYAKTYGKDIDWEFILKQCAKVNADYFFIAVLKICNKYLSLDYNEVSIPEIFKSYNIDEKDLLEDILSGGVYGATDKEELHGGTYMMNKAKHGHLAIIRTLFPSLKEMQGKVSYLNDKPYLLPYAWLIRIFDYLRGGHLDAYSKGKQRSELLKKYKVNK